MGVSRRGLRYAPRFAASGPSRFSAVITSYSDDSGGIYLSHVLGLQLVYSGPAPLALPWGATAAILHVTTVVGATALVGVFFRLPVRRAVTGPDRRAERERLAVARWSADEKRRVMAGAR